MTRLRGAGPSTSRDSRPSSRLDLSSVFKELDVLKVLSTQAAILLQNAYLVDELKQEIRKRKRAEKIAQANEQRFRNLFEKVPLCLFALDISQRPAAIVEANPRAEAIYGYATETLTSMTIAQLAPPEALPALRRLCKLLQQGQHVTIESVHLRRDGTRFPVRITATPDTPYHHKRIIVAIEDMTAEKQQRSQADAINQERHRIAREIHDGVAQDMAALRFKSELLQIRVDDQPQLQAELDSLQKGLETGITEIRRAIFALRPVALDEVGFFPALQQLASDFRQQNQLYVNLGILGSEARLPTSLELPLFRIMQEALNNISQHAQASLVWIKLDLSAQQSIRLSIRDNGQGFDTRSLNQVVREGHVGLRQMRERVEALKGDFSIDSQIKRGTKFEIILPI
ncbi:MAG: histidine kinase [Ardenticatenaceae bacterium]